MPMKLKIMSEFYKLKWLGVRYGLGFEMWDLRLDTLDIALPIVMISNSHDMHLFLKFYSLLRPLKLELSPPQTITNQIHVFMHGET